MDPKAYLQITMFVDVDKKPAAAKVFFNYLQPFLGKIEGALTKELLAHDKNVQVIHGFDSLEHAKEYLSSNLFTKHVAPVLKPTWPVDLGNRLHTVT